MAYYKDHVDCVILDEQLILNHFRDEDGLLRKASTQALISVWRWSGVELLEGVVAKLDGVSIMIPEARPK